MQHNMKMKTTHPDPHIEWDPQQDHHEQQEVSQAQADAEGGEDCGHLPDRGDVLQLYGAVRMTNLLTRIKMPRM